MRLLRLAPVFVAPFALACAASSESRPVDEDSAAGAVESASSRAFHVAPTGSPHGDGSTGAPWDLSTALNQPEAVQPGDTIWLHGGTYKGKFISRLSGNAEAPVVLRQAPGERAVIDGTLSVTGASSVYWGFEVAGSDPARPEEVGVNVRAPQARLINLVVHDHGGNGFAVGSEAPNAEVYGSVIYNNGSMKPGGGGGAVGQGIAAQNRDGTKRIVDNVVFNQFDSGIAVYGSDAAALRNFHIEGNAIFNSGGGAGATSASPDLLVGGGSAADGIVVTSNYTYRGDKGTTAVFGYEWGPTNGDLALTDNVLVGSTKVITWRQITAMRNAFSGAETLLMLRLPADAPLTPDYTWRENSYVAAEGKWQPFNLFQGQGSVGGFYLPEWQQKTGLDRGSRYSRGQPTGTQVIVRPNRYEPGRANIVVYNWDRQPTVTADVRTVLKRGARYEVRSALNFHGGPVLSGTYDGQSLTLPMSAVRAPVPVGRESAAPLPTGPEFGVFVLTPVQAGGATTPVTTAQATTGGTSTP